MLELINEKTIVLSVLSFFDFVFFMATIQGLKRQRKISDFATSKLATAAQGHVEIEGYAWPISETSFLSLAGEELLYYKVELEQFTKQKEKSEWVKVDQFDYVLPFYVMDTSAVALITPQNFEYRDEITNSFTDWKKVSKEKKQKLLDLKFKSSPSVPPLNPGFFSGGWKIIEHKIYRGCPILIHAHFESKKSIMKTIDDNHLINFYESIRILHKNKTKRNILFDKNRDGTVSEEELEQGHKKVAMLSKSSSLKSNTAGAKNPLKVVGELLCTKEHDCFFTNTHHDVYLKKQKRSNILLMLATTLLISFTVYCCLV